MRHAQRRVHVGLGHFLDGFALLEVFARARRNAQQQRPHQFLPILKPPVYRWSVRARSLGHGPHGECPLATAPPQDISRCQDAALQFWIGRTGMFGPC